MLKNIKNIKNLLVAVVLGTMLSACVVHRPSGVNITQTSRGVEITSADSIFFASGKYDITPRGYQVLDKIAPMLRDRTNKKIVVEGHTDNVGDAATNKDLSEVRALNVVKALVQRGVPKSRLSYFGYGETRPIASNISEKGRALNRRTTIVILGERRSNIETMSLKEFLNSFQ